MSLVSLPGPTHRSHFLESGDPCAILQPMHRKPYETPKLKVFGDLKRLIRQEGPLGAGQKGPSPAGQQPQGEPPIYDFF